MLIWPQPIEGGHHGFKLLACFRLFCFGSNSETVSSHAKGPTVLMTVSGEGWTIRLDDKARLKTIAKPASLDQACAGTDCISYSRKCDSADHPTQCDYVVVFAGELHTIALRADSESRARAAMACLAVLTRPMAGGFGATLPPVIALSGLDKDSG